MKKYHDRKFLQLGLAILVLALPHLLAAAAGARSDRVEAILQKNCLACHGGALPSAELNLDAGEWFAATVNVASREQTELKLVDPRRPERSYLLLKVQGAPGIAGKRMPLNGEPLPAADLETLVDWARSLAPPPAGAGASGRGPASPRPAFRGSRLINLPTTRMLGRGNFQFLVAHRFYPTVKSGYDSFFGLNGPAAVQVNFTYGVSDRFEVMFDHTNSEHQFELVGRWLLFDGRSRSARPVALSLNGGASMVTQVAPGEERFAAGHFKFNLQLSASYQFSPRLTFLLVPTLATGVNHHAPDPESTLALGTACKFTLAGELAFIGQWVPVLDGFRARANGWGAGLEYKVGKHVFQVFVVNSIGLIGDQEYIAGGDLLLRLGEFRFGFDLYSAIFDPLPHCWRSRFSGIFLFHEFPDVFDAPASFEQGVFVLLVDRQAGLEGRPRRGAVEHPERQLVRFDRPGERPDAVGGIVGRVQVDRVLLEPLERVELVERNAGLENVHQREPVGDRLLDDLSGLLQVAGGGPRHEGRSQGDGEGQRVERLDEDAVDLDGRFHPGLVVGDAWPLVSP